MSEEVKSEGKDSMSEVVSTTPKVKATKETWLKARIDYETGNFNGMRELASKYGLSYASLREKASREDWKTFKLTVSNKVSQIVVEKVESKVEKLFASIEKKAERYEKMVLASQNQAALNQESIPILDPDSIETYSKIESRIIDWNKLALGINDKVQVNGSIDVNVNVVAILEKIRGMERKPIDVEAEEIELSGCKLVEG